MRVSECARAGGWGTSKGADGRGQCPFIKRDPDFPLASLPRCKKVACRLPVSLLMVLLAYTTFHPSLAVVSTSTTQCSNASSARWRCP